MGIPALFVAQLRDVSFVPPRQIAASALLGMRSQALPASHVLLFSLTACIVPIQLLALNARADIT